MYCYKGLIDKLNNQKMHKTDLVNIGISSRTIAKIDKGEKIANYVLAKIANYLKCNAEDLYKIKSDNLILETLREEKKAKLSGCFYHELQIRMTYNSNHIEGSRLSEEQTRMIFETNTINVGDGVLVDDIIETVNHFRAIDYCIDHAEEELSEEMIKHIHYLLKKNTLDSTLEWFKVGDYKIRANTVGGYETTKPENVKEEINKILKKYLRKDEITFEDIVEFHAEFEHIHPFQDGNGRVGRLIAFKECLHHNIVPFYIEDYKKEYYYRGLKKWKEEKGWLIDTCYDGQDAFKRILFMYK